MSRNDQKLADFLLHHTEEARHLSSQRVAQMTGVSQSNVSEIRPEAGLQGIYRAEAGVERSAGQPPGAPVDTGAYQILSDDPIMLFMGLVQQDLAHAPDRIHHSEELVKKLA